MPVQIDMEMPRSCGDCRFCMNYRQMDCARCNAVGDYGGREIPECSTSELYAGRQEWCPLKETPTWHIVADGELPQKEDQYLVTISANGFVEVLKGFWKHGRMDFINEDGCYFDDLNLVATAWMKWPEPWEGVV